MAELTPANSRFLYAVCNKHFYKPTENQTISGDFPENMAKKLSSGHPMVGTSPTTRKGEVPIKNYIDNFLTRDFKFGIHFQSISLWPVDRQNWRLRPVRSPKDSPESGPSFAAESVWLIFLFSLDFLWFML